MKLSGLRQLFLAVICSLKSPFNRDSAAFEQRLITVSRLSLYPFCSFMFQPCMKTGLVFSLPLPQAQPRCSSAVSESQTIKEAKTVEVSAVPKWALGTTGLLLEGSCCIGCSARRHWWPSILDAWRGTPALKVSKGQSQVWEAEMESGETCVKTKL